MIEMGLPLHDEAPVRVELMHQTKEPTIVYHTTIHYISGCALPGGDFATVPAPWRWRSLIAGRERSQRKKKTWAELALAELTSEGRTKEEASKGACTVGQRWQ